MTYVIHVNATCRNIRRDKYSNLFALKVSKRFLTAILALVPVNRGTLDARLFENAHNLVCTMLSAAEHEHLFHFGMFRQKFLEERPLATLVDAIQFLTDAFNRRALRSNFHTHRIRAQNRRGEFRNFIGHRRTKEQILSIRRKHRHDLANVMDKAHVQHAVRFV